MRGAKWGLALVGAMLASAAMAQQTVQQQFDAASAALAESKWQEALTLFEALETRLSARSSRSLALVRLRKGEALAELRRDEEAKAAIESGLTALPASDPSLREDRLLATLVLAGIAERELDYAQAIKHYRAVDGDGVAAGDLKLRALVGLTRTGMFSDPATALADADRMMALVHTQPGITAAQLAPFQVLKGRVLLNLKRYKDAQQQLKSATRALGGLTLKVDINDLSARSDMSLALLLGGEGDSAREYLAYTGAGRISDGFDVAAEMEPPPCGGESDLSPTDVAVVEFSIRDDGSVGYAAPIYWSRTGLGVLAYAKAARGWSWQPENVKKVPPLLRTLTRVELRCSTAGDRPSPIEILGDDVETWLSSKNVALVPEDDRSDAVVARALTEELARGEREHGTASAHLVPVLSALAGNAIATDEERLRHLDRAIAIVRQASAPAPVIAHFEMRRAMAQAAKDGWRRQPKYDALLEDIAIRSDSRTAAAIRLQQAIDLSARRRGREAVTVLRGVRDMAGLAPTDPIRVGALARLSSLELAAGNVPAAQAAFQATGLTAQQCALIDAGPGMKRSGAQDTDFPREALQWGFEGWATIEHDVAADGRTLNQRAVIAYPPFVFSEAATGIIKETRYEQSYRPDGSLGCGGKTQRIVFRMPG